ncbi:hypothetical protein GR160_02940 [Flavobacterium sp. Sd200]|uniref:hypothetical protein n=1 Tax=Flavobacterium sp. Sd200 TaxID=2692211 RepID=UPI0013718451|nr:hypothetical protein [Flavobacterium sp. Sd200]MXN90170.1 hypothetical protein [Flavobacterium sp. Sd200]
MKKLPKIIAFIIVLIFIDALAATNVGYYATVVDMGANNATTTPTQSPNNERMTTATTFEPVPGSYSLSLRLPNGNIKSFKVTAGTYNSATIGQHVPMSTKYGLFTGYDWITKVVE